MSFVVDKYGLWAIVVNIILLAGGLLCGVPILFVSTVITYVFMMAYCYRKLEERILLFVFGISFFTFLMGREFLELFFHYKMEKYNPETNTHTYICMLLSILSIWFSYSYFEKKGRNEETREILDEDRTKTIRSLSKVLFYISVPFAIGIRLYVAAFVRSVGYYEIYTELSEVLYGNGIIYYISRLENLVPVSLGILCATLPTKEDIKGPFTLYVVYLLVSLGGGNRGNTVIGFLFIFIFLVYMQRARSEENWFKRKYIIILILTFPLIALINSLLLIVRESGDNFESIGKSMIDFVYGQGVSITVIKHAYEYADQIPKQGPYLLEFLHSGLLARLFGITVYHGNTVEHALYGGSFTHSLAYTFMRGAYLAGHGTGTSYIAELYYDLGYFGVVLGSTIYGWIFTKFNGLSRGNLFTRAVIFSLIKQFLWAPRGSYTGFIGFFFAPTTILIFVVVWSVENLLKRNNVMIS